MSNRFKRNAWLATRAGLGVCLLLAAGLFVGCREKQGSSTSSSARPASQPGGQPGQQADSSQTPGTVPSPAGGNPSAAEIQHAEAAPPPPVLRLAVTLDYDDVYVGESVPLRVYVQSPRAQWQADRDPAAKAAWPTLKADWPAAVRFELCRVQDDQQAKVADVDWAKARIAPAGAAPVDETHAAWQVPASVNLAEGHYRLRARLDPASLADQASGAQSELGAEAEFDVRTPQSAAEKASHLERQALLAYREGKHAEARSLAEQAVKIAPDSSTPQRVRALEAQADACLLADDYHAAADICRQIIKLASPQSEIGQLYTTRLKVLEQAIAKQPPGH